MFKCSICSFFASTTYKGVLRHLGTVNAHNAGFHVVCASPDCLQPYKNFHSYKTHLYRKHREMLVDSVQFADGENDPRVDGYGDADSPQQSSSPVTPVITHKSPK